MKVRLEFTLPEERDEHTLAIHGIDFYMSLLAFSEKLRRMLKYEDLSEEVYEVVENLRDDFYSHLDDHGVNLEMVE